jgi:hypothetical protein
LQRQSTGCVHVVEMNDEELCVSDDVLEEASAARYQMLPQKSKERKKKNTEDKPITQKALINLDNRYERIRKIQC